MENENKKGPGHNKKNKFFKPKGYFIEPPKSGTDTSHSEPSEEAKKESGKDRQKPHHHHSKNNQGKRDERGNQSPDSNVQNAVQEKEQSANRESGKKHHNKHHKQKNKQKNTNVDANTQNLSSNDTVNNHEKDLAQKNGRKSDKTFNNQSHRTSEVENIDTSEYEQIHFPAANDAEFAASPADDLTVPMVEVVGIRFKSTGKVYYFSPNGKTLRRGEYAIVETARGLEYGEVAMGNKEVKETETVSPLRPIIRVATDADKQHHKENKDKEDEAFRVCNEKIISHGLDMKLIDAQYTFDNSKLLFYFTSSGRVDFRDLVKDLASVFRTRIELRQIGIRDEAKLMGGMGMCGRPLCCTLFLSDFGQVSIKMAKEQNLSLNSAKISGICGRLMCCLRYEHETYEYEIKRTPPVDALVHTADGNGIVTEISPLAGTVKVRLTASPETPPKTYKREDVVMLQKKQSKDNNEDKEKK